MCSIGEDEKEKPKERIVGGASLCLLNSQSVQVKCLLLADWEQSLSDMIKEDTKAAQK